MEVEINNKLFFVNKKSLEYGIQNKLDYDIDL
jgi:hypothetical protein